MKTSEQGARRLPDESSTALLAALSRGMTVDDAARVCGLSSRSARRRLAQLRYAWSRRTTLAVVVEAVRRGVI